MSELPTRVVHVKISGKCHKEGLAIAGRNMEVLARVFNNETGKAETEWMPLLASSIDIHADADSMISATVEVHPREITDLMAVAEFQLLEEVTQ